METHMNSAYTTRYKCCNGWMHLRGDNGCSHRKISTYISQHFITIIMISSSSRSISGQFPHTTLTRLNSTRQRLLPTDADS